MWQILAQTKLANLFEWWGDLQARRSALIFAISMIAFAFVTFYNFVLYKPQKAPEIWYP